MLLSALRVTFAVGQVLLVSRRAMVDGSAVAYLIH